MAFWNQFIQARVVRKLYGLDEAERATVSHLMALLQEEPFLKGHQQHEDGTLSITARGLTVIYMPKEDVEYAITIIDIQKVN